MGEMSIRMAGTVTTGDRGPAVPRSLAGTPAARLPDIGSVRGIYPSTIFLIPVPVNGNSLLRIDRSVDCMLTSVLFAPEVVGREHDNRHGCATQMSSCSL